MEALDRLRVQYRAGAAGLEEPIDRLHAQPAQKGLVPAIAGAIRVGERLAGRRPIDHLADGVAMQRARGVHLGGGLGQAKL